MTPLFRRALAALALMLAAGHAELAVAQNGPPRPPEPQAAVFDGAAALRHVRRECRAAAARSPGEAAGRDAVKAAIKDCTKDQIKPYRRACAKEARGQGFAKRTDAFKTFVRGCTGDRLAAALAPTIKVQTPPRPPVQDSISGQGARAAGAAGAGGAAATEDDADDMGVLDEDDED